LEVATAMAAEEDWKPVFLKEPEVPGVESLTRFETVIRVSARVRPLEQWRTARELRGRIRLRLDELGVAQAANVRHLDPGALPPTPSPT
ncbi:MAG: mechanosensitive ion channel family protein, partial [Jatrophihabitans sp.]